MSGIPPAKERTEAQQQPSQLSYSEVMHERARLMIGKSASQLTAADDSDQHSNVDGGTSTSSSSSTASSSSSSSTRSSNPPSSPLNPSTGSSQADFRLSLGLSDLASYIIAPAIYPSDTVDKDSDKGHDRQNGDVKMPRPLYRYSAPSKITHNRAIAGDTCPHTHAHTSISRFFTISHFTNIHYHLIISHTLSSSTHSLHRLCRCPPLPVRPLHPHRHSRESFSHRCGRYWKCQGQGSEQR